MPYYISEFMRPIEVTSEQLARYRKENVLQKMKHAGVTSLKDTNFFIYKLSPVEKMHLARLMQSGLNQEIFNMI